MPHTTTTYRYFIELSYKGTHFHGWQIQPNAITLQETLQNALSTLLRQDILLIGAGRTDTGVHARFFVAHFDTSTAISNAGKLKYQLNGMLSNDIAIFQIYRVKSDAHARFDALSRTYEYHIHTHKNPFFQDLSLFYRGSLNVKKMQAASDLLFDYEDFTSFSRLHSDTKTNLCHIFEAQWIVAETNRLIFRISANRFLRNMVRAVVGTLLEVGSEKLTISNFTTIIEVKNRNAAGASAAAKGLFLTAIKYPDLTHDD